MKKVISLMIVFFVSLSSFAQVDHMRFMGIPLDGTINSFQAKLNAKGIKLDARSSKNTENGCRVFKGIFSGYQASIYVYYDESSKIVYRAKAVIIDSSLSISDNTYKDFTTSISRKYDYAEKQTGSQDGYDSTIFFIPGSLFNTLYEYLGHIDIYRSDYLLNYITHVDYTDTANSVAHQNKKMEDL